MRPVVNGLERQYGERVAFAGVDFYNGANKDLVQQHRVLGHPTFIVLDRDGKVVKRFVGFTEEAELRAALEQVAGAGQ